MNRRTDNRERVTLESKENLETGIFSGPPCTSKCLQPALALT